MKIELSKEECLRLAELEEGYEVGAGLLARDPAPEERPSFHWRDGWMFSRDEANTVHIRHSDEGSCNTVHLKIPAMEWDSIVRHLSENLTCGEPVCSLCLGHGVIYVENPPRKGTQSYLCTCQRRPHR